MKARDLFPTDEEYNEVKEFCKMFNGRIIEVVDEDKNILFETLDKYV